MKKLSGFLVLMLVVLALAVGVWWAAAPAPQAMAATANISPSSPGVYTIPVMLSGQRTASVGTVAHFEVPFESSVLSVQATARASGGTSPTLNIDVKENGSSILSTTISATAASVKYGTLSDKKLADEADVTIDLTLGGTSPTWDDILILFTLQRR